MRLDATAQPRAPATKTRGGATLALVLVVLALVATSAAVANRRLIFDLLAARNQVRHAEAFEAAEAGIEWATALLNQHAAIDTDCRPTAGGTPGATSFRERLLPFDFAARRHRPATWLDGTLSRPLEAACRHGTRGWRCHCPSAALAAVDPADGDTAGFVVRLEATPDAGAVRLVAEGCSNGVRCAESGPHGAASAEVLLAWWPALASLPPTPLGSRGDVRFSGAIGLHNVDPQAGGVVVDAGGSVEAPMRRVTVPPGAAPELAIVDQDDAMRSLGPEQTFARLFGVTPQTWRRAPSVTRLDCSTPCGAGLVAGLAAGRLAPMLWVDGDLQIDGPAILGTRERPVALVVTGRLRLNGSVQGAGVIHAEGIEWNDSSSASGTWLGALWSSGDAVGNAAADVVRDLRTLRALRERTGGWVRIAGSWRDFR